MFELELVIIIVSVFAIPICIKAFKEDFICGVMSLGIYVLMAIYLIRLFGR